MTGVRTRILLVEGNDEQARGMGRSLSVRDDWEIVRAGTLLEAIRHAGESSFDAAVLDADLPDGSGLDILDFLRIGSPGIRILLLSDEASEEVAFHALSHGAGDLLVKDQHLEAELPRRIHALLDQPAATSALVETLGPITAYESAAFATSRTGSAASAIDRALAGLVGGQVLAAGVWDLRGKPLATHVPSDMDADGIGFALATLHGQVGALWTYGHVKPTGYRCVIDVEGGVLGVTVVPGTYIVGMLFDNGFAARRAIERLDLAALHVLAALPGGAVGDDLPGP